MHAYDNATRAGRDAKSDSPSEELRIAVTFKRADGGPGLTKFTPALSASTVNRFVPDPLDVDRAIHQLSRAGFTLTQRGKLTASVRGTRKQYEEVFGTKLSVWEMSKSQDYAFRSFYFPKQGAPWNPRPEVANLIDDAYIQWPHIYMSPRAATAKPRARAKKIPRIIRNGETAIGLPKHAARALLDENLSGGPSLIPPDVQGFFLKMPTDVPRILNAHLVHNAGITGAGVTVVMIDSGFAHDSHPYFAANGYSSTVDLAPGAINHNTDPNGHGTGESANIFAVAPGCTFVGIKLDNDNNPNLGASVLEGFQQALRHNPQVISVSLGYDLWEQGVGQLDQLPNSLAALEAEIQAAVAAGITVVFSAGNGHLSFPGMMPEVVSAGGVFVDAGGNMQASDYASAFVSKIYSGRNVPDFCGLVGLQPHAAYIMLPISAGCEIDRECATPDDGNGDGTTETDGWGLFSGTSAAAPQLAGVCALLLEQNPSLTPSEIKAVLRRTARDVLVGQSNGASSDDRNTPLSASSGNDGATGAGLVDAFAAFQQV